MEDDQTHQVLKKDALHRSALKQAKDCYRKALGLLKDIYRKFSGHQEFIDEFTEAVYQEVIKDNLENLQAQYISDKSQLIEILCVSWMDHPNTLKHFEKYPEVMPHLMNMLKHPSIHVEVASLHVSMLKKLILDSLSSQDLPKRALR
jgi:hypothetical protein